MAQASALQAKSEVRFNRFMTGVYLMMAVGLAVTALVATWVSSNEQLMLRIVTDAWFAFGLFLIQIVLVSFLSAAVFRLSTGVAALLFLAYSALTGITISAIFIYYTKSQISYTFWVTAGMFLFASLVGLFIKRDLSNVGRFLVLALLGWLFGLFLTWFFPFSPYLNRGMNIIGILLFAGLTVWDTQRLKQFSMQNETKGLGGMVVLGALMLYLDFINLFLLLLRTSRR